MKKNQPVKALEPGRLDRWLDSVTWFFLGVLWILTVYFYTELPEHVPTHYGGGGIADDYDHKAMLFILPLIATGLVIFMSVLNKHPHKFNYLVRITEENAAYQYRNAMRLIRVLKLEMVVIFLVIVVLIFLTSTGRMDNPGRGIIVSVILATHIPTFYFLYKSLKNG